MEMVKDGEAGPVPAADHSSRFDRLPLGARAVRQLIWHLAVGSGPGWLGPALPRLILGLDW